MLARQLSTRRWWADALSKFGLRVFDLVIAECQASDPVAASERLRVIIGIPNLAPSSDAESLAEALIAGKAVPETEPRDAAHIAMASVHGVNYFATWNFKHIPNPHQQRRINQICRGISFIPSTICTPEQLLESYDDA